MNLGNQAGNRRAFTGTRADSWLIFPTRHKKRIIWNTTCIYVIWSRKRRCFRVRMQRSFLAKSLPLLSTAYPNYTYRPSYVESGIKIWRKVGGGGKLSKTIQKNNSLSIYSEAIWYIEDLFYLVTKLRINQFFLALPVVTSVLQFILTSCSS